MRKFPLPPATSIRDLNKTAILFAAQLYKKKLLMSQLNHKCVLVIEVVEDIREIIRRSLDNMENWQMLSANSIAEGSILIKTKQPDVILLEASLLDNCHTDWQQLQTTAAKHSIPLIFMSARVRAIDRFHFQQLGGKTAIAKPFDPKDLVETIS